MKITLTKHYKALYSKAMNEFYSTRQIAKILNLKTLTIRRWIEKGELPAYKFGKELRIDKVEFEKFVNERRIQP